MSFDRRTLIGAGLALVATPARAQTGSIARTNNGRVRGTQTDGILTFKGIRYGAPPQRTTMIFDNNSRAENDPRRAERELFAKCITFSRELRRYAAAASLLRH